MVIGVVTTSYPSHDGDFAGCFVRERVRELVAGGARVEVIAASPSVSCSRGTEGVSVIRVPAPMGLFDGAGAPEALEAGGAALVAAVGFSARLAQIVRERSLRWSAVESHWLAPCGLAATLAGRPHRAFAHGGDVALLERLPAGASLARYLGRRAALVFASADLRRRFERLCGFEVVGEISPAPIAPSVPRADRDELRRRLGIEGLVVLGVGRLVPVKGWDVLVRAVARLPEKVTLVIAGAGPEAAALARAARRVELRLLGTIDRASVADWMAAADLYVQPSRALANGRSEGTPLALREALAAGLPAVASRAGGLGEITHAGLNLVTPDDPAALASAMAAALHLRTKLRSYPPPSAKETRHTPRYNVVNSL